MPVNFNHYNFSEDYWAPGGSELTLLAGYVADINKNSSVLDIGCGSGCGSINLSLAFGVKCTSIDIEDYYINFAKKNSKNFGVEDNIIFINVDFDSFTKTYSSGRFRKEQFDLILCEGGLISHIGHQQFFNNVKYLLKEDGVIAFSDLIFKEGVYSYSNDYELPFIIPDELKKFYRTGSYTNSINERITESEYDRLLCEKNYKIEFQCYLSRKHWRNYYSNMQQHASNNTGPVKRNSEFARTTFIDEAYYTIEAQKYMSYFYCIARNSV